MKCHLFLLSLVAGIIGMLFVGCTFLPSSGPSLSRVKNSAYKKNRPDFYALIPVSPKVLEILNHHDLSSLEDHRFSCLRRATPEATCQQMPPASSQGKSRNTDSQTPLKNDDKKENEVICILGDIKTPSLIPLEQGKTHLLDAIAQAGGSLGKEYETTIRVNRNSRSQFFLLADVFEYPSKNILLERGDTLIVRVKTKHFLSFGAHGKLNAVPFNNNDLTLDEALAMIGGPDCNVANSSAILVYRLEPQTIATEMGIKSMPEKTKAIPVIYRLDLTQAHGFFLAHHFPMRDRDIVYTTTAASLGVLKFLHLLGGIFAPVTQVGGATAATMGAAVP